MFSNQQSKVFSLITLSLYHLIHARIIKPFLFLLVNKFGDKIESEKPSRSVVGEDGFATNAIVTINLAIEGDSTVLPGIRTRKDFLDSLSKIASDAQVGECLLAGEVLWAPTGRESLTKDDLYADYPNLIPL